MHGKKDSKIKKGNTFICYEPERYLQRLYGKTKSYN